MDKQEIYSVNIKNIGDKKRKYNLLMLAAEAGNLEVVNELIDLDFKVNLEAENNKKIPIDLAWKHDHHDVVLALLKRLSRQPKDFKANQCTGKLKEYIDSKSKSNRPKGKKYLKFSLYVNFRILFIASIKKPLAPIHIMKIQNIEGKIVFENNYEEINKIFTNPDVRDRKIVVMSIIGDYRKGKSFFLDYCLRFLYATVRIC